MGMLRARHHGPSAAPHGMIVGPDGAACVTEGGQNVSARVDPATRAVRCSRCRRNGATPTSTQPALIARACSGLPGRTASMAGSIPKPAGWRCSTHRAAPAPAASPPRRMVKRSSPHFVSVAADWFVACPRPAARRKPRSCRSTHANISVNAVAAANSCAQSRAIAASSVPMDPCLVRRYRRVRRRPVSDLSRITACQG
jgi:hypothetical protein